MTEVKRTTILCHMKRKTASKAVAYYRVSTREQGASGLGLAAQRRSVERFAAERGLGIIAEYRDIESGKHDARPGLAGAVELARQQDATLLIAKLDRLSRSAAFTMTLRDSGVRFVAVDLPEANTLTVGIMALLAQQEREMISSRTKAALDELRARGVRLGVRGRKNLTDDARAKGRASRFRGIVAHYNGCLRHARNYREQGWTLQRIAEELNASGNRTVRGKLLTARHVLRLLDYERRAKSA